jgi:hypothetical protein
LQKPSLFCCHLLWVRFPLLPSADNDDSSLSCSFFSLYSGGGGKRWAQITWTAMKLYLLSLTHGCGDAALRLTERFSLQYSTSRGVEPFYRTKNPIKYIFVADIPYTVHYILLPINCGRLCVHLLK